jgi:1-acyl-sn-glycerol-3-phosphate acyltransferase
LQLTGGILLIKKYKEKLPENIPFVICPNHSSYLDIVLLYRVFKNHFVFMGKKEIEKAPLFNIYFTSGMNILVDRSSKVGSHKAFKKVGEEIDKGHSVVIFPEGTIPHHAPYLKQPFKNGAFRLAIEKQVPIVPVTFLHNWKRLQGSKLYKGKAGPGYTKVIIHEKIETKGMTDDDLVNLREKVFNIINQPIIEAYGSK